MATGPPGHSLNGGVPNVNQGIGRAVDRILQLPHPERYQADRVVINVAMLQSGAVYNHKPESGWFSLDVRSLVGSRVDEVEAEVRRILTDVTNETTIQFQMEPFQTTPGGQLPGFRDSAIVTIAESISRHLGYDAQLGNAGSANLNVPLGQGTPAIGIGGERGGSARLSRRMGRHSADDAHGEVCGPARGHHGDEVMRPIYRWIAAAVLALSAWQSAQAVQQPAAAFDILIRNGRILDGTGNPWYRADIGIRGDRIVAMGALSEAKAATVIDAGDRYVTPGFIDVHSHSGAGPADRRAEARPARAGAGDHDGVRQPGRRRPDAIAGAARHLREAGHRTERRPVRAAWLDPPRGHGHDRSRSRRVGSREDGRAVARGHERRRGGLVERPLLRARQLLEDGRSRRHGEGHRAVRRGLLQPHPRRSRLQHRRRRRGPGSDRHRGTGRRRRRGVAHEGARTRELGAVEDADRSASRPRVPGACRSSPISIPTKPAARASSAR